MRQQLCAANRSCSSALTASRSCHTAENEARALREVVAQLRAKRDDLARALESKRGELASAAEQLEAARADLDSKESALAQRKGVLAKLAQTHTELLQEEARQNEAHKNLTCEARATLPVVNSGHCSASPLLGNGLVVRCAHSRRITRVSPPYAQGKLFNVPGAEHERHPVRAPRRIGRKH